MNQEPLLSVWKQSKSDMALCVIQHLHIIQLVSYK